MQAIHEYQLNTANAKAVGVSARLNEKGAYTGTFTRAEAVQSTKGTQGIEFSFKARDGQTADYLTLWTVNGEGQELYGRKVLDAILTCMKQRTIKATRARIKKYDHEQRAEVQVDAVVFPELMNKPVGLLLVREEYEKTNGGTDWKMVIVGAYEPNERLTPREVLEGGSGTLDKMIEHLADRPLKKGGGARRPAGTAQQGGSGFDDMGDDIPF